MVIQAADPPTTTNQSVGGPDPYSDERAPVWVRTYPRISTAIQQAAVLTAKAGVG
jgi:hypothetical protein